MTTKVPWIGLAASALGLVLLSRTQTDETSTGGSSRAVATSSAGQAQAQASQLPTTASTSPLIVLLGSGLVAVAIGWAAIRKYVTSPSG